MLDKRGETSIWSDLIICPNGLWETMNKHTRIQEQCLLAIISYIEANEKPPTRRELKQILGQKSTNGVNQIVGALVKKGYIKVDPPGRKRNIVVLNTPSKQLSFYEDIG